MSAPVPHPSAVDPKVLAKACEVRFTRRSGPGGQNRNKVETAVILTHTPTGLSAEASERRAQGENLKAALFRLRINLALNVRRAVEPRTTPSALWRSRCRGGRIVLSPEHDDFPAILAEALDFLHANAMDVKNAAAALGCSASQLTKLLKAEPRALIQMNEARERAGLRPLL